ncbi:hypothetical protein Pcinc_013169 [Petrolisthes cinctipes]|uniref:HTH CENPB-type domain-containing protein n=1 Tax=Petrolisthes cinctipes TaxID=88211 RepID=A0AAE1FXG4_PETCI|nr:hypothetical protein Pcinc_013169 [Petrolisthes cinctipes]
MERYLNAWISKKEREGVPENKKQIMEMAKEFYLTICDKEKVQPSGFQASTGWLYRFIDRKEIRNVNLTGEAASANSVAADNFPQILKDTIEEGSYDPECIYNMDECGLQYKMMPTSTFISRASPCLLDEDFKWVNELCNNTGVVDYHVRSRCKVALQEERVAI